MTIDQLRAVHLARPFYPFTIHLADGRSFLVPHSEFVSHSPNGRTIIVYSVGDSFEIIDLLLVSSIEVHKQPMADAG